MPINMDIDMHGELTEVEFQLKDNSLENFELEFNPKSSIDIFVKELVNIYGKSIDRIVPVSESIEDDGYNVYDIYRDDNVVLGRIRFKNGSKGDTYSLKESDYPEITERLKEDSDINKLLDSATSVNRAFDRVIGDGRKSYTITHGLNSEAIICQLWSVQDYYKIPNNEVTRIDKNNIQIDFEEALPPNSVQIVIQANKTNKSEISVTTVDWENITNIPFMPYAEMIELLEETNG